MTHYFISDLHLEESRPDITALFSQFLGRISSASNTLYILGDFFEVWIGDDDLSPFNIKIIELLNKATQTGLQIYFMRGNRDFLIGKKFLQATGCHLLRDEVVIKIAGVSILLMHGDTLCTADVNYLKFRKTSRNWFMQKLFLMKKLSLRRQIANNMRAKSKKHTSTVPEFVMDVTQAEVENVMLKHHVTRMIHGHTHRPATHHFDLQGITATRLVLAAWHDRACVLKIDSNGKNTIDVFESV